MSLKIICLGKTRESWIKQGIEEYQKRLNLQWKVLWQELKDASLNIEGSIEKVKQQEAVTLGKAISPTDYVIALDEKGSSLDSTAFAHKLEELMQNKDITFIIGGVYGLDKSILKRADWVLSFSAFTFPHQLIRLILIEQLYRARTIISGKTYHY